MTEKTKQICFGINRIQEILDHIRPNNNWEIVYDTPEHVPMTEWDRKYLQLCNGEDYFFIFVGSQLLYAVNVTGDSVLTAMQELITKLAEKF